MKSGFSVLFRLATSAGPDSLTGRWRSISKVICPCPPSGSGMLLEETECLPFLPPFTVALRSERMPRIQERQRDLLGAVMALGCPAWLSLEYESFR
ncbi:hypothetical protein PoB_006391200 [Plakobranchus ocellatus]|uniref:Uncharacterized protein n=1 Tax=Plakobranchus ocellatus TaxID=259542 RepID=A0AAV4CZU4_9GAST|nr:hypothetical protein PoB_006391200 [Plakobranchus ocellatus]